MQEEQVSLAQQIRDIDREIANLEFYLENCIDKPDEELAYQLNIARDRWCELKEYEEETR